MNHYFKTAQYLIEKTHQMTSHHKTLFLLLIINQTLILSLFLLILVWLLEIEAVTWETLHVTPTQYVICFGLLLGFFFVRYFLTLFFDASVKICLTHIVNQEPVSIGKALKTLIKRIPTLFLWILIMTTVGIVIRGIEYWSDHWKQSSIATHFLSGVKWLVAIFFVSSILITEKCTVTIAIRRSAKMICETWGSSIQFSSRIKWIILMGWIIALIPAMLATLIGGKIVVIIGSSISMILIIAILVEKSMIELMMSNSLFLYATGNVSILKYHDEQTLKTAFALIKYIPPE